MPKQFGQMKQSPTDAGKAKPAGDPNYSVVTMGADGIHPPIGNGQPEFGGGPTIDNGGGGMSKVPGLDPKTLPGMTPLPPEAAPEKKKKLDWRVMLKGGLDGYQAADQEDPLSMLAMMNANNESMKGQIY